MVENKTQMAAGASKERIESALHLLDGMSYIEWLLLSDKITQYFEAERERVGYTTTIHDIDGIAQSINRNIDLCRRVVKEGMKK